MNTKFNAGTIAKSKIDGGVIDIVGAYRAGHVVEYKIRWTEGARQFERYVAAADIDAEFEVDTHGTKFVYQH